jgi:hypothetical protein
MRVDLVWVDERHRHKGLGTAVLVAASRVDHLHHRPAMTWFNRAIARCETGGSMQMLPIVTSGRPNHYINLN